MGLQNHGDQLKKKKEKKLSLKSKLASGPHESNKDPQKLCQEENYSWPTGLGVDQTMGRWSVGSLLSPRVKNLGGSESWPYLSKSQVIPPPTKSPDVSFLRVAIIFGINQTCLGTKLSVAFFTRPPGGPFEELLPRKTALNKDTGHHNRLSAMEEETQASEVPSRSQIKNCWMIRRAGSVRMSVQIWLTHTWGGPQRKRHTRTS